MRTLFLLIISLFCWSGLVQANDTITITNGTKFIITHHKHGSVSPAPGDIIKMKLKKYSPDGILQFSTEMLDATEGVDMTLHNNALPGDILDVFLKLKPGEKATAFVPVWVADKDENMKTAQEFYKYEIELVSFVTHEELKEQQTSLLAELRVEQKETFDKMVQMLSPVYKLTYQKDGLYILKTDARKVKKKERIRSKEEIKVHYLLQLFPDMKELDNSYKRGEPFTLKVDDEQVIKGWDLALMQLKKGDKAILLIPSWLGYGFTGSGRDIGPNTPLYFEVQILD